MFVIIDFLLPDRRIQTNFWKIDCSDKVNLEIETTKYSPNRSRTWHPFTTFVQIQRDQLHCEGPYQTIGPFTKPKGHCRFTMVEIWIFKVARSPSD